MSTTIRVLGAPIGKDRPRFGKGFTYTPKRTVDAERAVRQEWMAARGECYQDAVKVTIIAMYAIPKSATKARRQLMLSGKLKPMVKPDADNIAKLVLDALNGVAYVDDKQVVELVVKKQYAYDDTPCVWVRVSELTEEDT